MLDNEYLYHCAGCKKPDKEYPDKETKCNICEGSGRTNIGFCNICEGSGEYVLYAKPIAHHRWAREDAYGIYTGLYCDKCYKDNYPYRRDRYHDESYCGERLNPDE